MSIISNIHTLVPFVSGESKSLNGQRLAKVGFKKTKDNPSPLASVCASVPFLSQEEVMGNIQALLPHVGSMLEGVQDQIIRALYEASQGQRKDVRDEEISVQACIAFLSAEAAGSRISAESIKAWFENGEAKNISAAIICDALKYGDQDEWTPEQEATILKHVGVYCEVFQILAGKNLTRGSFSDKQWYRLNQILELVMSENPEDAFGRKLTDKMDVIAKAVKVEELI